MHLHSYSTSHISFKSHHIKQKKVMLSLSIQVFVLQYKHLYSSQLKFFVNCLFQQYPHTLKHDKGMIKFRLKQLG